LIETARMDRNVTDYRKFVDNPEYAARRQRRTDVVRAAGLGLVGTLSCLVVVVVGVLWGVR